MKRHIRHQTQTTPKGDIHIDREQEAVRDDLAFLVLRDLLNTTSSFDVMTVAKHSSGTMSIQCELIVSTFVCNTEVKETAEDRNHPDRSDSQSRSLQPLTFRTISIIRQSQKRKKRWHGSWRINWKIHGLQWHTYRCMYCHMIDKLVDNYIVILW